MRKEKNMNLHNIYEIIMIIGVFTDILFRLYGM